MHNSVGLIIAVLGDSEISVDCECVKYYSTALWIRRQPVKDVSSWLFALNEMINFNIVLHLVAKKRNEYKDLSNMA